MLGTDKDLSKPRWWLIRSSIRLESGISPTLNLGGFADRRGGLVAFCWAESLDLTILTCREDDAGLQDVNEKGLPSAILCYHVLDHSLAVIVQSLLHEHPQE